MEMTAFVASVETLALPADRAGKKAAIAAQISAAMDIAHHSARAALWCAIDGVGNDLVVALRASAAKERIALLRGRMSVLVGAHDALTGTGFFSRSGALGISRELFYREVAVAEAKASAMEVAGATREGGAVIAQAVDRLGVSLTQAVDRLGAAAEKAAVAAAASAAAAEKAAVAAVAAPEAAAKKAAAKKAA